MGSIGGMLGLGGGASGTGFAPPAQTGLTAGTTADQLKTSYTGNQDALTQQQALVTALQAQNGLGNQSSVFNQLQGVANGTGPNPAQAQLAQATGANTANQAALMAGQRGSGQNVGLIARQAALQGAANQQNAAGQAATMQANQSLNALGQLGGIANTQAANQIGATTANTSAQQQEQNILQGANSAYNTANVAQQGNVNNANASLAQTGMQGQQAVIGGLLQGAGSAASLGKAHGGIIRKNYANGAQVTKAPAFSGSPDQVSFGPDSGAYNVTAQPISNTAPAVASTGITSNGPKSAFTSFLTGGASSPQAKLQQGVAGAVGGLGKAIGNAFKSPTAAQDTTPGAVAGAGDNYATSANNFGADASASAPGAADNFGVAPLSDPGMSAGDSGSAPSLGLEKDAKGGMAGRMAKGGKVPAMLSPGERYLNPREVAKVASGKKDAASAGEKIPGKAKVKGDSLKNDTVPKTLEEGGIVLPKSVMESKNPHWAAHKFVSQIMLRNKGLKR